MLWTHAKEGLLAGNTIFFLVFNGEGRVLRNDQFPETWEPYDSLNYGLGLYQFPAQPIGASKVYVAPIPTTQSGTFVYIAYRKAGLFGFDEANDLPITPFGELNYGGANVPYPLRDSFGQVSAWNFPQEIVQNTTIERDDDLNVTITLRDALKLMLAFSFGKTARSDAGNGEENIAFRDVLDRLTRVQMTVDADGNRKAVSRNVADPS